MTPAPYHIFAIGLDSNDNETWTLLAEMDIEPTYRQVLDIMQREAAEQVRVLEFLTEYTSADR